MAFIKSGNTKVDNEFNDIVKQLNYEIGGDKDFTVVETKRNQHQLCFKASTGEKLYLPTKHTSIYNAILELEVINNSVEVAIRKIREDRVRELIDFDKKFIEKVTETSEVKSIQELGEITSLPTEAFQLHKTLVDASTNTISIIDANTGTNLGEYPINEPMYINNIRDTDI